jgi:error-prone DNA polymerase
MALSDAEDPLFAMPDHEPDAPPSGLPAMPLGQEVMADFATAGLSLKCHPVALVRKQLDRLRITPNIRLMKHTGWIKVAGVVLIRQRPGTASGIVFITLEDETARHSYLLQADGYVERQGQVVHVMVKRLHDLSSLLEGHHFRSRDFH